MFRISVSYLKSISLATGPHDFTQCWSWFITNCYTQPSSTHIVFWAKWGQPWPLLGQKYVEIWLVLTYFKPNTALLCKWWFISQWRVYKLCQNYLCCDLYIRAWPMYWMFYFIEIRDYDAEKSVILHNKVYCHTAKNILPQLHMFTSAVEVMFSPMSNCLLVCNRD